MIKKTWKSWFYKHYLWIAIALAAIEAILPLYVPSCSGYLKIGLSLFYMVCVIGSLLMRDANDKYIDELKTAIQEGHEREDALKDQIAGIVARDNELSDKLMDLNDALFLISSKHRDVASNYLNNLVEKLHLGVNDVITVYLHTGNTFRSHTRIDRNNANPRIGAEHSDEEGVLGAIWRANDGTWFDNAFPNPENEKGYEEYLTEKYKFKKRNIRILKRKCVAYFGSIFYNQGIKAGVVLVESYKRDYEKNAVIDDITRVAKWFTGYFETFNGFDEVSKPLEIR